MISAYNTPMTLVLSERLTKELERASREEGLSPSELAERFIDRALALKELSAQRRRLEPRARNAGFNKDEDFFKAIS